MNIREEFAIALAGAAGESAVIEDLSIKVVLDELCKVGTKIAVHSYTEGVKETELKTPDVKVFEARVLSGKLVSPSPKNA